VRTLSTAGRQTCIDRYVRIDVHTDNMTKKFCRRCACEKPVDEFHQRSAIQQAWCKQCRREYDAEYWRRTSVERTHKRRQRRRERLAWYRRLKEGKPCADCGGAFHHAAMQWDHLPGAKKDYELSNMVLRGFRRTTILEEIAKCELVCANCHAVRTFNRASGRSSAW
jgi:hypothetical protein